MKDEQNSRRRFIEEAEHEEFTHKIVWQVVRREIEEADANPVGSVYRHLVAMVFCAHAIEGYLNFLGDKLVPSIWRDERTVFKGKGIEGKLDFLREILELAPADRTKPPFSTLATLKTLRDKIAHPRPMSGTTTTPFLEGEEPEMFHRPTLAAVIDPLKVREARDHVKRIADDLHTAAMTKFPNAELLPGAMEGIMAFRSSRSRLDDRPLGTDKGRRVKADARKNSAERL